MKQVNEKRGKKWKMQEEKKNEKKKRNEIKTKPNNLRFFPSVFTPPLW